MLEGEEEFGEGCDGCGGRIAEWTGCNQVGEELKLMSAVRRLTRRLSDRARRCWEAP